MDTDGLTGYRSNVSCLCREYKVGQADNVVKMLLLDVMLLQVWSTMVMGCTAFCERRNEPQWCQNVLWIAVVEVILCGKLRRQQKWQRVLWELCERQSEQQRCQGVLWSAAVEETVLGERLWGQQRWHCVLWSTMVGWDILRERKQEQQCCCPEWSRTDGLQPTYWHVRLTTLKDMLNAVWNLWTMGHSCVLPEGPGPP